MNDNEAPFADLGKTFVEIGRALQDPTTTLSELVTLIYPLGWRLDIIAESYDKIIEEEQIEEEQAK